jgi:hypothetical protein
MALSRPFKTASSSISPSYSANHVLTLVAQDYLQPFAKDAAASKSADSELNEMQPYQLPWPIAALQQFHLIKRKPMGGRVIK